MFTLSKHTGCPVGPCGACNALVLLHQHLCHSTLNFKLSCALKKIFFQNLTLALQVLLLCCSSACDKCMEYCYMNNKDHHILKKFSKMIALSEFLTALLEYINLN